ncbi:MAG TPA: SDR family NAD(P)-dependent oxidoreductase, partial [Deferrisomatales bacterium]|nr:SDR family NAD(P)-dependent oxidoreductase [Deferrisomatales bacterium]
MNEQRVALITGGGQGIGRAIARRLVTDGWSVTLAEIDIEAGKEAEAELGSGEAVRFVATDVACEPQVAAAVNATLDAFGRLDALVNNAGIAKAHGAPPEQQALEDWNRVLAVNLTGPFLCAKHCATPLRAAGGAIVNIASTRALMSEGCTEAYSASKGGVLALTHALAISLGPVVRVNCVSPGWIDVGPWQKLSARRAAPISPEDHAQHPAGRV